MRGTGGMGEEHVEYDRNRWNVKETEGM